MPTTADTTRHFTLWALDALDVPVHRIDERIYRFDTPKEQRELFNGAGTVRFSFDEATQSAAGRGVEVVSPDSPMFRWLVQQLQQRGQPLHAVPAVEEATVHAITPHLFAAYQVDGGRVHLGGCTFEQRPLLRLTYQLSGNGARHASTIRHVVVADDGFVLDEETAAALGLDDLHSPPDPIPDMDEDTWQAWRQTARVAAETYIGEALPADTEPVLELLVWCSYATGKLTFEINGHETELAFDGWAQLLAHGRQKPPPLRCPRTNMESYHVAVTDDGEITVADAVETCGHTGRRTFAADLETCAVTGMRAVAEFLETCPVSGGRVLQSELVKCSVCRQDVSRSSVSGGRCRGCRQLRGLNKDDPRMARVLGEYPGLEPWRKWRLSETHTVYILVAGTVTRRLLLVLDKESLEPRFIATSGWLGWGWTEMSAADRDELLGN